MWDKISACTSFVLSIFDFKDDNKNWSLQDTSSDIELKGEFLHIQLQCCQ